MFLRELVTCVERFGLAGRGFLVGLSGGLDSTCLLRGFSLAGEEVARRLEVAHVDHSLRVDSAADAEFCRRLAAELGVPFHLRRLVPGELRRGPGTQAEARRVRREYFEAVRVSRGLDAVVLGHHAGDQAETVLYRLVRGTGPRGLGAMAAWTPPYLRPLLGLSRADLEAVAAGQGWEHRDDPSNRSPRYLRNRVRAELLPLLRTFNPQVERSLARLSGLAAEDDALLSALARSELERHRCWEPEGLRVPVASLAALAPPLRRRLYLAAWEAVGCDPSGLESRHLEAVDSLLHTGPALRPNRRAATPGPGGFARSYNDLWILRPETFEPPSAPLLVGASGRRCLPGTGLEVVWGREPPDGTQAVALPVGPGGVELRLRRPGDRVGAAKVKDLLMEARIPPWRRARAIVVEADGEVLGLLCGDRVWKGGPRGRTTCRFLWLEPAMSTVEGAS